MGYAIKLEEVTKNFGHQIAVQNVNMSVPIGNITGIVGRNGSGKTVLMKMICGLMAADNGSIWVNGSMINKGTRIPTGIGAIIEAPGFLPHYSGYQNLALLASIQGKINMGDIKEALSIVGLNPSMKKHVHAYSLGMRQRLGIAQAIMEKPSILILDEPMNGLDNNGAKDMRKLFRELSESGLTIVMASHNAQDIDELCDIVCEMDAGVMRRVR